MELNLCNKNVFCMFIFLYNICKKIINNILYLNILKKRILVTKLYN